MSLFIDLTGMVFGRLTVIKRDIEKAGENTYWICKCDCGNQKSVYSGSLKKMRTKSCGCLQKEMQIINKTKHGLRSTPEYHAWAAIKQRCFNRNVRNYSSYGGRGITMHPEWINSFKSFYDYVGPRPSTHYSIDRIDNDGNYEPGNVRWATITEQANNTRKNIQINHDNKLLSPSAISILTGVNIKTIYTRIYRKYSIKDILKTPIDRQHEKK